MSEDDEKGCFPLKRIIPAVVIVVLLVSVSVFFFNFNGGSVDFSNREIMVVPTGSMDGEPRDCPISTIPKDSLIMVHLLNDDEKKELKVGDVVTFHQGGLYKVHRIIKIDGNTVTTQGDANSSPDPSIEMSDITGKVVGVAPVAGKVVTFIRDLFSNSPLFLILAIAIIIVMIYSIIEIVQLIKKGDEEEEEK